MPQYGVKVTKDMWALRKEEAQNNPGLEKRKVFPFIYLFLGNHVVAFVPGQKGAPGFAKMFAFPSFNTEKDVIAYKSFMLADRMEAQWSQNSQNVLLLMVLLIY